MLNIQPTREVLRPENQLELSEKELDEEIAKMLTANNPAAPKNIARYDQKLRTFKFEPMVDMNMVRAALHTHSNAYSLSPSLGLQSSFDQTSSRLCLGARACVHYIIILWVVKVCLVV
jgi:hypothetical protein